MVLLAVEPELSVLLIKRPDTLSHHAGQLACPGGSYDPIWDQTLWETARRETQEEVGILVPTDAFCGFLDSVFIPITGYTIAPVVAVMQTRPPVYVAPSEVASYAWIQVGEFSQVRRMGTVVTPNGDYRMPEFLLSWGRLWGATARIVDELLRHLQEV